MKNILRWVAVIPAVLGVWIIVVLSAQITGLADGVFLHRYKWGGEIQGDAWENRSMLPLCIIGGGGYGLVWAAFSVAPAYKRGTAFFIAAITAAFFIFDSFYAVDWMGRLVDFVWVAGIACGCFKVYHDDSLMLD